jgi:hypothetical protein
LARATLLFRGVTIPSGTFKELVAMHVFSVERAIAGLTPLFASDKFDPEKLQKKLRGLMYPEERFSDVLQMKKSMEFFNKVRGKEFRIKAA